MSKRITMNLTPKKASKRLQDLMILLFEFADIERQIFFPDRRVVDRRENDAEHSYSLAICAWYLSQYIPELNKERLLKMALAHDIVEVHAGDVMAIGRTEEEEQRKIQQEKAALETLRKDWPDFAELTDTIEAYENKNTEEAKFVSALDKILPVYLNMISQGKTWKFHAMSRNAVLENKDAKTNLNKDVKSIWQELKAEILTNDEYFNNLP